MVNADVNRELLKDAVYYQKEDMAAIARYREQTGRARMRYWVIWKNICRFPGNRYRKPASLQ